MVASRKHTVILLLIIATIAIVGYVSNARGEAAHPNRIALYVSLIVGQVALARYAIVGLRVPLREITGDVRLIDAPLAAALWLAIRYLSSLVPHNGDRTANILPHSRTELIVWIVLAIAAGIAEELVFRGYLQKQIGLPLQAVVFGIAHGYQGIGAVIRIVVFGLIFGLVARYRRGLAPCMLAHAALDISAAV